MRRRTKREGSEPRLLASSLDQVALSLGAPSPKTLAAIFGSWPEMVGEIIAAHAQPRRLEAGTLIIDVDDPAWATELRFRETDLVTRAAAVAGEGEVRRIRVTVRDDGSG
jgi:predicted nucleic acid-binding Zn ribbon protein